MDLMGKQKKTSNYFDNYLTLMGNLDIVIMNRVYMCKRRANSLVEKSNYYSSEVIKMSTEFSSLYSFIKQHSGTLSTRLEQLDLQMSIKIANHVEEDNVEMCNINKEMKKVKMLLARFAHLEQSAVKKITKNKHHAEAALINFKTIKVELKELNDVTLITSCSNISPGPFDAFFTQFQRLECVIEMLEKWSRQMDYLFKVLSGMQVHDMVVELNNCEAILKKLGLLISE